MTKTLVHLLHESVSRCPDTEAIVLQERRVTYRQLWREVSSVAGFLRTNGLAKEARVGILHGNSPEYAAIYYGTLAAGGTAIGLNTSAKAKDLLNWLNHSESSFVFASAKNNELHELAAKLDSEVGLVIIGELPKNQAIDRPFQTWEQVVADENPPEIDLDGIAESETQLAAFIYTSGTTGNPKGVTLSHKNLLANTRSILEYLELKSDERIVNVLPFYYSYGNSILHTHLAVGGTIILENSLMYPHKVVAKMAEEKATGFSGVPSTFALLLSRTKLQEYDLRSVRYLSQAGGPMPPANVERLKKALPHVRIFIMYGQTEATARLTYLPPERLEEKLGSCGIPIPGVRIEIRDAEGNPCPPGTTGEICATGDNIMLGYWKNPEDTAKVVVDGWLKTGDLAHFDDDRYIFIDGRSSEMIKSGGQRISPKEIEEVISELDGVAEVGVVGIDDEMLGQIIKAFIVRKPDIPLEAKTIQAHCLKNLASYKIPKHIEFTNDLPKTASGKLRRHLLLER